MEDKTYVVRSSLELCIDCKINYICCIIENVNTSQCAYKFFHM